MVNPPLRFPVLLASAVLSTTFLDAGGAAPSDEQPTFRIVTPNVSDIITQDVTPEIAQRLHMSRAEGVLIRDVTNSPLRPGDVILSINGNPVRCEEELEAVLDELSVGKPFTVEVFRDGRTQTVTVQEAVETPAPAIVQQFNTTEIRGIRVTSLSNQDGVMVAEVQIGTPASQAGLRSGDIILEVEGHPVYTADQFLKYMRQLNNNAAVFSVLHTTNCRVDVFVIPVV